MPRFAELAEGVRRIVASNTSMMTGPGTNTYLFGTQSVAVLDPGPCIEEHIDNIVRTAGAPVQWILVTHTHPDHSPGAKMLAEKTGAELIGRAAPEGEHQDASFIPDRALDDGDRVDSDEFIIQAIHTPGHASNHLCYRHAGTNWVATGDHVIDGSTVVINPPDGNMKHYLRSLERLKAIRPDALLPGHGERIDDPERVIDWIISHRLGREAKVFAAVESNPELTSVELVPHVYEEIDEKLYGWAERSLLAHLLKLADDGRVRHESDRWRTM